MTNIYTIALILAGGSGQRYGANLPKQFVRIGAHTVLEHSIAAFEQVAQIDAIIIVSHPEYLSEVKELLDAHPHSKVRGIVAGGKERQDSTLKGLRAAAQLRGDSLEDLRILVHDAVRPAVSSAVIKRVCQALDSHEAVNLVVPVVDTLLEVDENGLFLTTPDRSRFRRVQTPQGFHAATLQHAYDIALRDPHFRATDDCGVVSRYLPEVEIALVEGEQRNLKLTYPEDFYLLEQILTKTSQASE